MPISRLAGEAEFAGPQECPESAVRLQDGAVDPAAAPQPSETAARCYPLPFPFPLHLHLPLPLPLCFPLPLPSGVLACGDDRAAVTATAVGVLGRVALATGRVAFGAGRAVLDEVARTDEPQTGDLGVMVALGPGMAAEAALLKW